MKRAESLSKIAKEIETMLNTYGRVSAYYTQNPTNYKIEYHKLDENLMSTFSDWSRKYHGLLSGEECFFIYEPYDDGLELLYVVNVTGDSLLTAASELMHLVAKKF